jgi:hypothetical protein
MNDANAAVKMGWLGCQMAPATGLDSLRPTTKSTWFPKIKAPHSPNNLA